VIEFLAGKVAIVTGAGTGLGAAVARLLSSAGAAIVLVSRSSAGIQAVAQEITSSGGNAMPVAADIASPDNVDELVNLTMQAYGRIDFVINIAGTVEGVGPPLWEITDAQWRQLCDTNIAGPVHLCRKIVPVMIEQQTGRILMLTSSSADMAVPTAVAYGATKAAVNQLIRALAAELAGSGVVANVFNPGPVATPTLERVQQTLQAGPWRDRWDELAQTPDDAARMVLWLCSPSVDGVSGQAFHWRHPDVQADIADMMEAVR
jgi:NAD(P)-dependent dehydrogenase (short-subunit alcohol dehydrogenase family)